jgi:hypothetical protein
VDGDVSDHASCIALYNSCKAPDLDVDSIAPRIDLWVPAPEPESPRPAFEPAQLVTPVCRFEPVSEAPFKVPIA